MNLVINNSMSKSFISTLPDQCVVAENGAYLLAETEEQVLLDFFDILLENGNNFLTEDNKTLYSE